MSGIWSPPSDPIIKINFDAEVFDSGYFRMSVVARDSGSKCIPWSTKRVRGLVSPKVAEANAARHALIMAKEMGWTHIQLEGDCMVVVNALSDQLGECLRPFGVILTSCREIISFFNVFSCSFIRRSGNCFAHEHKRAKSNWLQNIFLLCSYRLEN